MRRSVLVSLDSLQSRERKQEETTLQSRVKEQGCFTLHRFSQLSRLEVVLWLQKDHEAYCQMVNIMFCWAAILQKSSAKQFPAALGIIQMHISPVVWKKLSQ